MLQDKSWSEECEKVDLPSCHIKDHLQGQAADIDLILAAWDGAVATLEVQLPSLATSTKKKIKKPKVAQELELRPECVLGGGYQP